MLDLRVLGTVLLTLALLVGCGGKKSEKKNGTDEAAESADQTEGAPECDTDEDCYQNEVCLDGKCTSTAGGAIYTNPGRAVTPGKVKREVEKRLQQGADRRDEYLEENQ